jgi:hypothetical protein
MGFEAVEMCRPEPAVRVEPLIERLERSRADSIQAPLGFGPDFDQSGVLEHAQVLRHGRLAQVEAIDQITDRPLSIPEQVKDFPAAGLAQYVQRGE